ncbi:MAG: DUF899 family protein [candidate division Zixibacteria bacterium]|jgi:predicted dithiol-disulfide oxidoreductase (DUF899 family)|nr:DUF899 family protein [candidate division Zixibacteria bacterium]
MTPAASKAALASQLQKAEKDLEKMKNKVLKLRRKISGEQVEDHPLRDKGGETVRLSSLFGNNDDLIVVHNMGKHCRWCTLWADGLNGLYDHLASRASFVVVSNDPHDVMKKFAEGRNWRFKILSGAGSPFSKAMGYMHDDGSPQPGVSTFHRDKDGTIRRVAHTWFGPGDDFCAVWPIFDMLQDGVNGWEPQYQY